MLSEDYIVAMFALCVCVDDMCGNSQCGDIPDCFRMIRAPFHGAA